MKTNILLFCAFAVCASLISIPPVMLAEENTKNSDAEMEDEAYRAQFDPDESVRVSAVYNLDIKKCGDLLVQIAQTDVSERVRLEATRRLDANNKHHLEILIQIAHGDPIAENRREAWSQIIYYGQDYPEYEGVLLELAQNCTDSLSEVRTAAIYQLDPKKHHDLLVQLALGDPNYSARHAAVVHLTRVKDWEVIRYVACCDQDEYPRNTARRILRENGMEEEYQ